MTGAAKGGPIPSANHLPNPEGGTGSGSLSCRTRTLSQNMFSLLRSSRLASRQLTPTATAVPSWTGVCLRLSSSTTTPPSAPPPSASASTSRPQKHKKNKSKAAQAAALASAVPRPSSSPTSAPSASSLLSSAPSATTREPPLATFASLLELGLRGNKAGAPADGQAIALTTAEGFSTPALLKTLQNLGLLQGDKEQGIGAGASKCTSRDMPAGDVR